MTAEEQKVIAAARRWVEIEREGRLDEADGPMIEALYALRVAVDTLDGYDNTGPIHYDRVERDPTVRGSETERSEGEEAEDLPQPLGVLHSYWNDPNDFFVRGERNLRCYVLTDNDPQTAPLERKIHEDLARQADSMIGLPVWDAGDGYVTPQEPGRG
jgi:hypothetical protein